MTDFRSPARVWIALLLVFALSLSLCGCSFFFSEEEFSDILNASDPGDTDTADPETERVFALSYYTGETLDPFTSTSRTNSELLRLCYSGLFTLDSAYHAQPVLAASYEADENTVTIRLREDILFSDGSPVTAADCVESYRRAAQKDSVWASVFSYIRSYSAVDEKTLRVTFYWYFPSQLNLLTMPVVKSGASDALGYPVGCGRYAFSSDDGLSLDRSVCNCIAGEYSVGHISLLGIADEEALIYNFNYGRIQAVCADLSEGANEYRSNSEIVRTASNQLTFLVVNRSRKYLADLNFSKGLTYLIDRSELVSGALNSYGTGVWYPLNPAWSTVAEANLNPEIVSASAASEAFTASGFVLDGTQRRWRGESPVLKILVNKENPSRIATANRIAELLRGAGFTVEVAQAAWDEYKTAIRNLDFDLYLGEVNLPADMDLTGLFSAEVCNNGLSEETYAALRERAAGILNGQTDVRDFVNEFQNALPLIPLYYAADALAVSMDVNGTFGGSVSEIYSGIENWTFR